MNKVLKCGVFFGLVGYAITLLVQILAVRLLISPAVIRVFVPITNLTMMFPVDISWTSVLVLIGPINAAVYFVLGTLVCTVYERVRALA
jgi:hypothetical protein